MAERDTGILLPSSVPPGRIVQVLDMADDR
jgi:hypothetical protein